MSAKVVKLVQPEPNEPIEELVELFGELKKRAKDGEIRGVTLVFCCSDGTVETILIRGDASIAELHYAGAMAQQYMLEYEDPVDMDTN